MERVLVIVNTDELIFGNFGATDFKPKLGRNQKVLKKGAVEELLKISFM